ncbi:MAG: VOC family protein [Pseudolabrys sp.]|nr:VOC family protein [Pseudolabrys sp.]
MPIARHKITPCLWFDKEAEDAARFYVSVFKNSRIGRISRYSEVGHEIHGGTPGAVLAIEFELDGQPFSGLNGGPIFKFSEAVSFQVPCDTQEEIDYHWTRLQEGGGSGGNCGWLTDRFGLSWQVFPAALLDMLIDADRQKADRAMAAMLKMNKLDLAALQRAFDGK